MRVVMACRRRALAGGGADEDETQAGLELIGQAVHERRCRIIALFATSHRCRAVDAEPASPSAARLRGGLIEAARGRRRLQEAAALVAQLELDVGGFDEGG